MAMSSANDAIQVPGASGEVCIDQIADGVDVLTYVEPQTTVSVGRGDFSGLRSDP